LSPIGASRGAKQEMTKVHRHALVRHSAARMYGLVNDVASYPERFAWCDSAQVLESSDTHMLARLEVRVAGFPVTFTTRNTLEEPTRIALQLVDGPFSELHGQWRFHSLAEDACKVSLDLDFEVAGRLVGSAMAIAFRGLGDLMVDDFCREADRGD
jgi:ribosome-associated toxin RatA of RatAB toxin-antitoxin module